MNTTLDKNLNRISNLTVAFCIAVGIYNDEFIDAVNNVIISSISLYYASLFHLFNIETEEISTEALDYAADELASVAVSSLISTINE